MKKDKLFLTNSKKKLKELLEKSIHELIFDNKVTKTNPPKKEDIIVIAYNEKNEFYCLYDGKIYIKNRDDYYLYIDETLEELENSRNDLEKIIE
jgi:hypothetical protein